MSQLSRQSVKFFSKSEQNIQSFKSRFQRRQRIRPSTTTTTTTVAPEPPRYYPYGAGEELTYDGSSTEEEEDGEEGGNYLEYLGYGRADNGCP